jgi:hypothetical protein
MVVLLVIFTLDHGRKQRYQIYHSTVLSQPFYLSWAGCQAVYLTFRGMITFVYDSAEVQCEWPKEGFHDQSQQKRPALSLRIETRITQFTVQCSAYWAKQMLLITWWVNGQCFYRTVNLLLAERYHNNLFI